MAKLQEQISRYHILVSGSLGQTPGHFFVQIELLAPYTFTNMCPISTLSLVRFVNRWLPPPEAVKVVATCVPQCGQGLINQYPKLSYEH